VARVVDECLHRYGALDLLLNCAAVQSYAWFEDMPWEELTRVLDVTLLGYLRFARAVLPHFRARRSGHIVNALSMLSVGAAPLLSAYTAAKHALLGWQDCLRIELAGSGVEVSGVLLPSLSTPMFDHAATHLGCAPLPVPPTYDTDVAARALVRVAERPSPHLVPVFWQGRLLLWLQRRAPWFGNFVMSRFGVRLQSSSRPADRAQNNLFQPVERGVGPYGSVRPTARWKLALATLALVAVGGAWLAAVTLGAVRGVRTLRR
jgi:NAD(P)-dependent dehydrogenase (short-subunit alcohol dehydrogenase family)